MSTGVLAGVLAAQIGGAPLAAVGLCAGISGLAALVPDWLQVNVPGVKQVKGLLGHRGFSHWIWTALAVGWLLWPTGLGLPVAVGWLSHIALDAFSNGVPAFWPLGKLTLGRIKTGGRLDAWIGAATAVVAVVVFVNRVWR